MFMKRKLIGQKHPSYIRHDFIRNPMLLVLLFFVMLNSFSVYAQKEIRINTDKMENDLRKKVLIINSYHQGHPWTDGITKGILSVLKNDEIDIETHI